MTDGNPAFLQQLSLKIKERFGKDLSRVAVVFPNRRAGLFFRKYLSAGISMPMFSPLIFSIEDFILKITEKKIGANHQLLLLLYDVYQEREKEKAKDLDDFLNWAPVMLQDFNEIDLYLADSRKVFTFLSEAKKISLWNPEHKELTDFQQSYLHFYHSLQDYYIGFKIRLEEKHLTTQGLAYRYAADHIDEIASQLPWQQVVFAGFNALTQAEEKVILSLMKEGKADIYWDSDEYYVNNPVQEAGKFLRSYKNRSDLGIFRWTDNQFRTTVKNIRILGIPQHIGQAKVAGQLLAEIPQKQWADTAVVLGDENMLIPVLNSIPSNVTAFNVTMGLPLRLTPLNGLFESLFQLHLRSERYNRGKEAGYFSNTFYFKDLLSLFRHPWFSELLDANHANSGHEVSVNNSGLKEREELLLNKTYYTAREVVNDMLKPASSDLYSLELLFDTYSNNPLDIVVACQHLTAHLKNHFTLHKKNDQDENSDHPLVMEYLFAYSLLFSQIRKTWEDTSIPVTISSLHKLFRQSVQSVKLSFYGEPLKGLQVMGMLETRNLDFQNIILLHVNDDILPAGKSHHSFIPLDIKEAFNLPTYRDRQAVFAYHFYRLLQRSSNIHLLYNTEPGQLAGGEKSRFIHQLQQELPLYNPQITITEEILSFPPLSENIIQPIVFQKNDLVMEKIRQQNKKGWSPTALNQLRLCPVRFYFDRIEEIEEPEEAEESMDAATLGTAFHASLEMLFKPFLGQVLTNECFTALKLQLPSVVRKVFTEILEYGDLSHGKNLLLFNVAESLIGSYLERERKDQEKSTEEGHPYTLLYLEKRLIANLGDYILAGKADRIDQSGTTYKILDYKSGNLGDSETFLGAPEKLKDHPGTEKIFQLLFYSYLFYHSHPFPIAQLIPGIVSMKKPEKGIAVLRLKDIDLIPDGLKLFEDTVRQLLDDLYNPEIPFIQTDKLDVCKYCAFQPICIR